MVDKIYNDLLNTLDSIFNKPITQEGYYKYRKEKREAGKRVVYKYEDYIKNKLMEYAVSICDLSVEQIPGFDKESLYKHRIRYGVLPNIENITISRSAIPSINARIVEGSILVSQCKYIEDRVKETGPLDLETPITEFYFSTGVYRILKEASEEYEEPLKLKHLIDLYFSITNKRFSKEIRDIITASGYSENYLLNGKKPKRKSQPKDYKKILEDLEEEYKYLCEQKEAILKKIRHVEDKIAEAKEKGGLTYAKN